MISRARNPTHNDASHNIIDLRNETVTAPSPAMLQACLTTQTNDDILREDPTVMELEDDVARTLFNKQAGLFVPTDTMANLVAI